MFMSLSTGRILHRNQWKKLPINDKIINRVEELGDKEKQGYVSSNFKYKWKNVTSDDDISDNESTSTNNELVNSEQEDEVSIMSVNEFMT